ncbi:MAG TPA: phytanoyl-CoA dioxygenase family protein, partial [Vicinamibacterales bacterium]|nr:phytanoyl-CoA dioxygenase family protein [Vicinamibacterales bacterium]
MSGHTRSDDLAAALFQLSDAEVSRRVALARDESYWRALAPGRAIGGTPRAQTGQLSSSAIDAASERLRTSGYFETVPILASASLDACGQIVDAVAAEGWPPVFAWIYDELWECVRLPDVEAILTAVLGGGYHHLPHPWVHDVPAVAGAAGWYPHFDGDGRSGVSIWIALSTATAANGCMHVVPRPATPESFRGHAGWGGGRTIPAADAVRALHASVALPVERGAVLGWTFDVLHWGGTCSETGSRKDARRSISLEFIAADEPPEPDEVPLLDPRGPFPPFGARLRFISRALSIYEMREA